MVSDGICGAGEDQWVKDKLAQFDGASPKDLARELITDSPKEVTDDRTALVIRIEKRAAGQMKSSLKWKHGGRCSVRHVLILPVPPV